VKTCTAMRDCGRPVWARSLCQSHYRQFKRGEPFRRIRASSGKALTVTARITPETRDALGPHPSTKARAVLHAWAKRNPPKKQAAQPFALANGAG
jgi:hypothetical protein